MTEIQRWNAIAHVNRTLREGSAFPRTLPFRPVPKSVSATYIAKQSAEQRPLLEKLDALVTKTLPDATPVLKWGIPIYQLDGKNVCAIASFKEHVGINFFASPDVLVDPKKKLEGGGKTQRMLKVRKASDIDAPGIARWLLAASAKK
jgi:hypothetical protein